MLLPSRESHDGYADMEAFIYTISNSKTRKRLESTISGRGAFRRFKDALHDYPDDLERWYKFKENRIIKELIDWLEENDLEADSLPENYVSSDNVIVVYDAAEDEEQENDSSYITDIQELERLAEEKWDENCDFRTYIKVYLKWSDKRLDDTVKEIYEKVKEDIDCAKCRNCCIKTSAVFENNDITKAAKKLGITKEEFQNKYIEKNKWGDLQANSTPCPFFKNMNCELGDSKPVSCKDYPFLQRKDFRSRTLNVLQNASLCPIIYNTIEVLKEEIGWENRKRRR